MDTFDESIEEGQKLLLKYKGTNMAMMTVTSKWMPDKPLECLKVMLSFISKVGIASERDGHCAGVRYRDH